MPNVLTPHLQSSCSAYFLLMLIGDIPIPVQEATSGQTALHLAVETQEHSLVWYLLQAAAQVDAHMHNGCTPLYLAAGWDLNNISSTLCEVVLLNMEDEETPEPG